jgi:hypothetical protein
MVELRHAAAARYEGFENGANRVGAHGIASRSLFDDTLALWRQVRHLYYLQTRLGPSSLALSAASDQGLWLALENVPVTA